MREEALRAKIEELGLVLRNRDSAVQTGVEAIAQSAEPELAALQKMQEMERNLERVEALAHDQV